MKNILSYFDLNKRRSYDHAERLVHRESEDMTDVHLENRVSQYPADHKMSDKEKKEIEKLRRMISRDKYISGLRFTILDQALMYLGIFIGVLLSSTIAQFKAGNQISFEVNLATIIVSAAVALIIVPQAFEKLKMQPSAPLIVRFGFFVQNGVFWRVIFEAVGKAISA